MDSIVEAKVHDFLQSEMHYPCDQCGSMVDHIRQLARVAGYELDERFANAGLAAGPEAAVASAIVGRALGQGGTPIAEYTVRTHTKEWVRKLPRRIGR